MINEAVILLGGMGTRLLPYTKVVSKEMLPIYDNPIIYYLVKELYISGIKRIIFVVNQNNETLIKKYFSKNIVFENNLDNNKKTLLNDLNNIIDNMEFIYVQQNLKGTYGALYSAKDKIKNDNFIVFYGDDYLPSYNSTKELLNNFYQSNKMQILIKEEKNLPNVGIVKVDKDNYLENLVKKDEDHSNAILLGRMILNKKIFNIKDELVIHNNNELYLSYALLKFKKEVLTTKYNGFYFNIGEKMGFIKANIYYIMNSERCNELKEYLDSFK